MFSRIKEWLTSDRDNNTNPWRDELDGDEDCDHDWSYVDHGIPEYDVVRKEDEKLYLVHIQEQKKVCDECGSIHKDPLSGMMHTRANSKAIGTVPYELLDEPEEIWIEDIY